MIPVDVSMGDILGIGEKIVEMADRVRLGDSCLKGTRAIWSFTMGGVTYDVQIAVNHDMDG